MAVVNVVDVVNTQPAPNLTDFPIFQFSLIFRLGSSRSSPPSAHGPTQKTPKLKNTKISTLSYAIKMDPINAALAALELQDSPNYTLTAKEFYVNCSTLSRRYRQITRSREDATEIKSLLLIQQERTLLGYINHLTKRGLPPTP